MKFGRLIVFCV